MARLIERLGFSGDPFAEFTAENEPEIEKYFVQPPYFSTVSARAASCRSYILFGARGSGKSATRLALYKDLWAKIDSGKKAPLAIMFDSYSAILKNGIGRVSAKSYVQEVAYRTIEMLLVWLSSQPDDTRANHLSTLPASDEKLLITFVDRFYLVHPEPLRELTAKEVMGVLGQTWKAQTGLWMSKKWNGVAALIATLASSLGRKAAGIDANVDENLVKLLTSNETDWDDGVYATAVLSKLVDLVRAFDFLGITVLVDKVDETAETSSDAQSAAALLSPIVANTKLLEIDGLGWIFFLWDQVKKHYGPGALKVRLDKIGNAEISWEPKFLKELVGERIWHFSKHKSKDFGILCEPSFPAVEFLENAIAIAAESPRQLLHVLDVVITTHDEVQARTSTSDQLGRATVDLGLDRYSVESAREVYDEVKLAQVIRIGSVLFTNKDVQTIFRIGQASARTRIQRWTDAGLVARAPARAIDATISGKPAHEFSILDPRVRRIVERKLDSGLPFEEPATLEDSDADADARMDGDLDDPA